MKGDDEEKGGSLQTLFPQRAPGFLVRDFHGDGSLDFGRRKNREKIERFRPGVESCVNDAGGKINGITWAHDALFLFDPLFGGAGKNVEDFLHLGMMMEIVRLAGRKLRANEHEIRVRDHPWFAVPEMRLARQLFHFRFALRDDAPFQV